MNEESDFPPSAPTSRLFWIALAVIGAGITGAVILPALVNACGPVRAIDVVTSALGAALADYKEQFGSFPAGDSRTISKALRGDNPKQMQFIELGRRNTSPEGDLLDPWGTPFRFYFSGDCLLIRSAGPNKEFDDSMSKDCDDYFRG